METTLPDYNENTGLFSKFSVANNSDKILIAIAISTIVIIHTVLIAIGVGILLFGIYFDDGCDVTDPIGINLSGFLIGAGLSWLFLVVSLFMIYFFFIMQWAIIMLFYILVASLIKILFDFVWLIIGGFVIFRSNLICIEDGYPKATIVLIIWILFVMSALGLCGGGSKIINVSRS